MILAEGEKSQFDFNAGPAVRMSEEERERVLLKETSVPHRTHRFKKDFVEFGYTDRCAGCSALMREMRPQPHTDACRARVDQCKSDRAREKSSQLMLESRKRRSADDSVNARASSRDDMLDKEDIVLATDDKMGLEELADGICLPRQKAQEGQ